MRGLVIERAKPSNVVDIYDLFKRMAKGKEISYPVPTDRQIQEHYFKILQELNNPYEIYLLARRGRAYYGVLSANIALRPFGEPRVLFIKYAYVAEKKRNLGIGKKMTDALVEVCQNMGVSVGEFLCEDKLVGYWEKKLKAKKVLNYMVIGK